MALTFQQLQAANPNATYSQYLDLLKSFGQTLPSQLQGTTPPPPAGGTTRSRIPLFEEGSIDQITASKVSEIKGLAGNTKRLIEEYNKFSIGEGGGKDYSAFVKAGLISPVGKGSSERQRALREMKAIQSDPAKMQLALSKLGLSTPEGLASFAQQAGERFRADKVQSRGRLEARAETPVVPAPSQQPQQMTLEQINSLSLTQRNSLADLYGIARNNPQALFERMQAGTAPTEPSPTTPTAPTTQYQNLLSQTDLLKTGARGEEVKQLQQFLESQGFAVGNIDGKFGPKTAEALRSFQQSAGIATDAIVGPQTRKAIQDKLGAPSATPATDVTPAETAAGPGVAEGGEPNQKDLEYFGILQSLGLDVKNPEELAAAFRFQPARTFEELYKDLYEQTGLDKIKENVDKTIAKLKEVDDKHEKKVVEINENPWISESLRSKKISAEDQRHQSERGTEAENLQLWQKQFEDAQDEIKFTAKETLSQYYKEKEFEQDELERILARADKELASRQKVRETEAKAKAKEDRELTISEAQKMNVPFGTKLSEIRGTKVPTKTSGGTVSLTGSKKGGQVSSAEIDQNVSKLNDARGDDGYTDPNLYKKFYDSWLSRGGSVEQFFKFYPPENYINPAEQAIPLPKIIKDRVLKKAGKTTGGDLFD